MERDERISTVEARKQLGRLVNAAHFGGACTVITSNGEPRAVVVPYEWYREAEARRAQMIEEKKP